MPRFSWLFNATQAPFKNAKEKPREFGDQEGELKTDTNGKESTRIDTNPSIGEPTVSDDTPSWHTWLRKAADMQRISQQSFSIDPPVINIWNNDNPASISTGTVPKPKSSPSPKSRKSSKQQQQQKIVHFDLEATTNKKEEPAPKLNMQNSRIIFQSPQLTVILTPPEGETQDCSLGVGSIERRTPTRDKSTRERERGGERRNPFPSIRNHRLGKGNVDEIHTRNTNTHGMTRNFPNRSSPNLACTPFNPGHYHTLNPNLNYSAQNPRFSISAQNLSRPHTQNHLAPSNLTPTSPTQYNTNLLTPPPQSFLDARRIRKQNERRELKEVRGFMIKVLNREGGHLKNGIRGKIMGLYGIGDGDLDVFSGEQSGNLGTGNNDKVGGNEGGEAVGGIGERDENGAGTKKIDEGVDFGVDSCEKEDLKSLEMVFRGRFSGSWNTGSMRGRVSA